MVCRVAMEGIVGVDCLHKFRFQCNRTYFPRNFSVEEPDRTLNVHCNHQRRYLEEATKPALSSWSLDAEIDAKPGEA